MARITVTTGRLIVLGGITSLGSILNLADLADYDYYLIVVPLAIAVLALGVVLGIKLWPSATKLGKTGALICIILSSIQLFDLVVRRLPAMTAYPHMGELQTLSGDAFEAIRRNDYERAEQVYRTIISKENSGWFKPVKPNDTELRLADVLLKEGKLQEAKQTYKDILQKINQQAKLKPEDSLQPLEGLGEVYKATQEYDRSFEMYKRALAIVEEQEKQEAISPAYYAQRVKDIRKKYLQVVKLMNQKR